MTIHSVALRNYGEEKKAHIGDEGYVLCFKWFTMLSLSFLFRTGTHNSTDQLAQILGSFGALMMGLVSCSRRRPAVL